MKQFMAVYIGAPDAMNGKKWTALPETERNQRLERGMKAWGDWVQKNSSIIKVMGGPLGKTKQVNETGVHDIRNNMTGYIVIEAASHEEAAKLFLGHPHFSIFPGDSVEVMECLPIPGAK